MSDAVNPSHYKSHPSGVECIEIVEHLGFNLGNAIKYLWRAGLKSNAPTMQDHRKARWYLERALGRPQCGQWHHATSQIDRVLVGEPTTLTRVLSALYGVPSWHHDALGRDIERAIVALDCDIERMESEAA